MKNPLKIDLKYKIEADPDNPDKGKWTKIPKLRDVTKREAWIWYIKSWFQLFRAQTVPLSVIIVLAAYLHGTWELLTALVLIVLVALAHMISYGHNSLMDTAMGYDTKDPSKLHHPLISGVISLTGAHNVIHLGMIILTLIAILVTVSISPVPVLALIFLIGWFVLGQTYNDGLSKESLIAAPIISLMTVCMVAWGWFLSHSTLDLVGILYLGYIFVLIMFQISWDGSLKDIRMPEKSNILTKLGVKLEKRQTEIPNMLMPGYTVKMVDWLVIPDNAGFYAYTLKAWSIMFAIFILFNQHTNSLVIILGGIWIFLMVFFSYTFWRDLIRTQKWNRDQALSNMSFEQILAIYLPIPLLIHPVLAVILMIGGVLFFWGMNRFLWETTTHPRV